jgi:hypothetical protein
MSQHKIHIVLVVAIAAVMSFGLTARSVAAQPLNDDFANAFVISGPGYSDSGSTDDATESPDDPAVANGSLCGGGNTVWYTFTAAADTRLVIDTFGSAYDTTLGVYVGGPGSFAEVTCNDDWSSLQSRVEFDAAAGVTYGIVIGTCCWAGNLYGGNYVISVSEPPPPFDLDLTIDGGSIDKVTGVATITGTITCNTPGWFDLYILVEQRSGKLVTRGEQWTSGPCEGATPVSLTVRPSGSVAFKSGRVGVTANFSGCDSFTCDSGQVVATIKL